MDTKYLLAEALKICMKKAPLEKITVKDITDTCGISRQTYYRHFQDKQDLVNWYFEKILNATEILSAHYERLLVEGAGGW